jgi:acyl phosphate:glycerol-3-phosphate acyltransferase
LYTADLDLSIPTSLVPVFGHTLYFYIFACLMAFMVIFKHKENIQRLLSGTENKLTF